MRQILVLNGPNLNMLGTRETAIYGSETLDDIARRCAAFGRGLDLGVEFRQTNSEAELVGWIQTARATAQGLAINAGALTHTSIAIHDALRACALPVVEVHLSNLWKRESFRHHSYVSPVVQGVIAGFGAHGYELAMTALARLVEPAGKG